MRRFRLTSERIDVDAIVADDRIGLRFKTPKMKRWSKMRVLSRPAWAELVRGIEGVAVIVDREDKL